MTQEEKAEQVIKNIYKYVYNKSTKSTQHAVIVLIRDIRLYLKIDFNKDKKSYTEITKFLQPHITNLKRELAHITEYQREMLQYCDDMFVRDYDE